MPRPGVERSEKPPSIDSARARMFFNPWPASASSPSKPSPSSRDRDEALAEGPLADRDLGARRVRVLAHVRQPLLDDPEDLDLLVGREADRRVDLELDLEPAVGGQHVDVAAERGVERGGAACGREREDRESRFLLREDRGLLDARRQSSTGAPASSIDACVETAKRYCARPS